MSLNVGTTDRLLRVIVGIVLLAAPFLVPLEVWSNALVFWAVLIVGAILAVTGAVGFCPLYALLGLDARPGVKPRNIKTRA